MRKRKVQNAKKMRSPVILKCTPTYIIFNKMISFYFGNQFPYIAWLEEAKKINVLDKDNYIH